MSNKKLNLLLIPSILLIVVFLGSSIYFLFFARCPYKIGTNIMEWVKQSCSYVIQGVLIDRVSEEVISNVVISYGEGKVYSPTQGEFIIKFRGKIDKIFINKEGYHTKEIKITFSKKNREINLGKVFLEPEVRVIGTIIDWLSENPLSEVSLTFGKGEVRSSAHGEFIIKTSNEIDREDINKLVIKKDGYQSKEVGILIGKNDREIDLGKINLVAEGRVIYQKGNSIFSVNFNGLDSKKLTDGELVAITPTYDKFVFKTQDSALQLMDIQGDNQMKFAHQPSQFDRPPLTTFSLDGNILAWISRYEVEGPEGKSKYEEVFYFNFELEKMDSVSHAFRHIDDFRISPDGKYIAVMGISYDGSHTVRLEDIVRRKPLLQIKNPEKYFFDQENFFYSVTGSGWYIYHFQNGKVDQFDPEPSWRENKLLGIINPYTKKDMAILRPVGWSMVWSIKMADINGFDVKKLVKLEPPSAYVKNLRWSSNKNYLLFEISQPHSLYVLDINSGKYNKIDF